MHDVIVREIDRAASSFAVDAPDLQSIVKRGRKRLWMRRATGALGAGAVLLAAPFVWTAIDAPKRVADQRQERSLPPAANEWQAVLEAPIEGRVNASSVWTGDEFLVWGGATANRGFADGAAYNPRTKSWRELASSPLDRAMARVAVWTGREMIVWGGEDGSGSHAAPDTGAAYDPATDSWRELPRAPFWSLASHTVVWTGKEMIVFGGVAGDATVLGPGEGGRSDIAVRGGDATSGAAAYNPATNEWRSLPEAPIAPRHRHAAVWTGGEMLVWGGRDQTGRLTDDGAAFDPATNTWRIVSDSPLSPREEPLAIAIDDRVVMWGGTLDEPQPNAVGVGSYVASDGAIYDPGTDSWERIPSVDLRPGLPFVQGGAVGSRLLAIAGDFALFDVGGRQWTRLSVPTGFGGGFAVATSEHSIFVWSGFAGTNDLHNRGALLTLD